MSKVDRLTGKYWDDYEILVKQAFPDAFVDIVNGYLYHLFMINTGEIERTICTVNVMKDFNCRYLGKTRRRQHTAWKSAWEEVEKMKPNE